MPNSEIHNEMKNRVYYILLEYRNVYHSCLVFFYGNKFQQLHFKLRYVFDFGLYEQLNIKLQEIQKRET